MTLVEVSMHNDKISYEFGEWAKLTLHLSL